MEHDILPECRDRFIRIEDRLQDGDKQFDKHGERLSGVEHDVSHLTKSLDGVTKALWGVAVTGGAAVVAFIFWVLQWLIQNK